MFASYARIPFFFPNQTTDIAPQDRGNSAARSRANYRTGDKCRRVLLFFERARARAPVYLVSDLHRSPISGLCSKYT